MSSEWLSKLGGKAPSDWLVWLLLTMLAISISGAYLLPGLPKTDDLPLMVLRATGFHQSVMDGHLPVRWIQQLNENYGYPVTNFLYPLPFYVIEIFQILGFSALIATKIIIVLATILSGLGMYLLAKALGNKTWLAGLVSLWFLLIPYRLTLLYDRGSLGEIVALGLVPWILWLVERFCRTPSWSRLLYLALLWSVLIPSHNSAALLYSGLISLYWIVRDLACGQTTRRSVWHLSRSLASCLVIVAALSAWFWLPALHDLSFTRASQVQIASVGDHFIKLTELLPQLGYFSWLVMCLGTYILWREKASRLFLSFLLLITLMVSLLQLPASLPFWRVLGLERLVQFPLRFFLLSSVVLPLVLVTVLSSWQRHRQYLELFFMTALLVVVGISQLQVVTSVEREHYPAQFFLTNFDSSTNQAEFTPLTVSTDPDTYATKAFEVKTSAGEYQVLEEEISTQEKYLKIQVSKPLDLAFNTHFFPGWQLSVDGELVEPEIDAQGRPVVTVAPAQRRDPVRTIRLIWQETPLRQFSNWTSMISFLLVSAVLLYRSTDNWIKTAGALAAMVLVVNLVYALFQDIDGLKRPFDPAYWQAKYQKSQWVDPVSTEPLGDSGLYLWAGWSYLQGENPILINSEMPPLGKYLIGLGVWLTGRAAVVAVFFSLVFLGCFYLLARQVLNHGWLALIPVALFTFEPIFISSITDTSLDTIQLSFICLTFWAFIKALQQPRWFVAASLFLGGAMASKFYATSLLLLFTLFMYLGLTKQWRRVWQFSLSLPLVFMVHLFSYARYFALGHNLFDYLRTQAWILDFYRQGSPQVPWGSYWRLVFLNQWRVWWGPRFGEYYLLQTKEWTLLWPLVTSTVAVMVIRWGRKLWLLWRRGTDKATSHSPYILISWLSVYAVFLTLIGGWPRYMFLFLPFGLIILVQQIINLSPQIYKRLAILKKKS